MGEHTDKYANILFKIFQILVMGLKLFLNIRYKAGKIVFSCDFSIVAQPNRGVQLKDPLF